VADADILFDDASSSGKQPNGCACLLTSDTINLCSSEIIVDNMNTLLVKTRNGKSDSKMLLADNITEEDKSISAYSFLLTRLDDLVINANALSQLTSLKRKRSDDAHALDLPDASSYDLSVETVKIIEGIECIIDTLDDMLPFPDMNSDILSAINVAIEEMPLYRIEVIAEANLPGMLEALMR
jgi:hypothetical protein